MAATARVEFVRLGAGPGFEGVAPNIIKSFHGAVEVDVDVAPTPASDRPVAPAFGPASTGYALVRCFDNPIVVAWGEDPNAAPLAGKMILPGEEVPIFLASGQRLSFIEVAG